MVPGTSRLTFKDGKCTIRGDFIERWSPVGGEGIPDLTVQITDSPLMGEIHMTSDVPLMLLLHTNVFVTQFTTEWGGGLSLDNDDHAPCPSNPNSSTHTVDPMRFRVITAAIPNPDTADYGLAVASLRHAIKIFTFFV